MRTSWRRGYHVDVIVEGNQSKEEKKEIKVTKTKYSVVRK